MMTTLICLLSIAFAAAIAFANQKQELSQQYEAIPVPIAGPENFNRPNPCL